MSMELNKESQRQGLAAQPLGRVCVGGFRSLEAWRGLWNTYLFLSLFPFPAATWAASSATHPCHDTLPCHRPKGNRANWLWTETSNMVSPNKPFLLISWSSQMFVTLVESWPTRQSRVGQDLSKPSRFECSPTKVLVQPQDWRVIRGQLQSNRAGVKGRQPWRTEMFTELEEEATTKGKGWLELGERGKLCPRSQRGRQFPGGNHQKSQTLGDERSGKCCLDWASGGSRSPLDTVVERGRLSLCVEELRGYQEKP
jgi:hypothetical protein